VSVVNRQISHFQLLHRGTHGCKRLQDDFNAHGAAAFEFEVVQLISDGTNFAAEKRLIELHDATNPEKGYNTMKVPIETPGRPKVPDDEKSMVFSFSIYQHHDEKVSRIMKQNGLSRSAAFQKIIEDGYKKLEEEGLLESGPVAD